MLNTEHVVVLFTDIVGSTEQAMAASAEAAEASRRAHFSVLRQVVTECGGTEVKTLGDGLMVVFGAASSAIACAVAMQQGVEADNRDQAHPIGLRVGLSGGETTHEDDDYFGDPVIEAARLCGACGSGQILATEVVRLMAGRRNRHDWRPLGALTLKGLPEPVESIEVCWEPIEAEDAAHPVPLPNRLTVPPNVGVIGRLTELETLAAAGERIMSDERRELVLISGEAGLGKTTLVAEAARRAHALGSCVLFGHCEEDLATPYQLFAEALAHYVTHAPEEHLRAHVAVHGSELARIVPQLVSRIPDLPASRAADPESERYLVFAAVVGILADASADEPVVVVLDDLQWADKASLLMLRHLVATDGPGRLLLLGTFRDDGLHNAHPLLETLAALHRQPRVTRIDLPGMDRSEVVAFMEAVAGYHLDQSEIGLADAVHRETDGNPFFVTEVLRNLSESGAISRDARGRWQAVGPIERMVLPESLREVIGARVGRLGLAMEQTLAVAAVIGSDFDLELLVAATGRTDDELLDQLDVAASASLVHELPDAAGRYRFAHALIQHALYQDLGHTRRARAHVTVGTALEALCGDRPGARIGELARHWCNTSRAADVAKAVGYARAAGDAALASLSPADALRYYTQARELAATAGVIDPSLDIDLMIGIGTAQRQTGDPMSRETLLEASRRAVAADDTERLVVAALANDRGWASASGTVDTDKVELLQLVSERLPQDHLDRALVLGNLCAELAFTAKLDERRALADEALALAQATGSDAATVRVLNHLVFSLLLPSLLDQSLAWSADALARAQAVDDPVLLYFAATYREVVAVRAGDVEEVDRCLAIAEPLVRMLNQPPITWEFLTHRSRRAQLAGDTALAEALATEAFTVGAECGQPDAETFLGVQLAAISWQRGTMGDLVPLLEQMVADSPGLPTLRAALALACTQAGRLDDSRALLEDFAANGFELPEDVAWLNGMTEYAEAAVAVDEPRFALPLFELLKPFATQFSSAGGVTAEGPVATVLGGLATALERYDEAEGYFRHAEEFCRSAGARFFEARNELAWGTALLRQGRPERRAEARGLLERALSAARAQGYAAVEREAEEALAGDRSSS